MAGESSGLWNNLPSIIIVEIFSLLNSKDRLNASSVCKSWRNNLFHPKLWRKVIFQINSCDNTKTVNQQGARFLAKNCGRFVREVVLEVNSSNPRDVQACKEVLKVLTHNNNLRALSIKPLSSRLEWRDYDDTLSLDQYVDFLLRIIKHAKCLEHLSLGCIEELLDVSESFLAQLSEHQASSLRSLHLSSVKEVPGNYLINNIHSSMFRSFQSLERLSIDYDYVDDQLLEVLSRSQKKPLGSLTIHVHSFDYRFNKVSESSWHQLSICSPSLEVTLNLLHFQHPPSTLHPLLCKAMPLTHFRVYFSPLFSYETLGELAFLNEQTLRSLVLVDELNADSSPSASLVTNGIDPLIMLAWKCKKLMCVKIIGYEVGADTLIAVARLKGEQLSEFQIPESCIFYGQLQESAMLTREEAMIHTHHEVAFALQRQWCPTAVEDLPLAIRNVNVDADGAYLDQLLKDQTW